MVVSRNVVALAMLGGMVGAGCLDPLVSPWTLGDDPRMLGIRADVVEGGPYADLVGPSQADRPRAQLLPLDTVQFRALFANADGPVDLDRTRAQWLLCKEPCVDDLSLELAAPRQDCDPFASPSPAVCRVGTGGSPTVVMPELLGLPEYTEVLVVTGTIDGRSTAECMQAITRPDTDDTRGCGIGLRDLAWGPGWALLLATGAGDSAYFDDLPPLEVLQQLPPNAAPEIEEVQIGEVRGALDFSPFGLPVTYSVHEPIALPTGLTFSIEPTIAVRDIQYTFDEIGERSWLADPERVLYRMTVDEPTLSVISPDFVGTGFFTGPDEPAEARVYVTARDQGGAVSWFVLHLVFYTP